jgi:tetratricopeptide (TPR) repeat protein
MLCALPTVLLVLGTAPAPWELAAPLAADPAAVLRAAAALEPPRDVDVDILLEEARIRLDHEGRSTATYRLVYRPLSREAAERWSEVAHPFAPWYQASPEVHARVITPDGAAHLLDPSTLVEAPLGDDREHIYSDRRLLRGPLPATEPWAVVEEVVTLRDTAAMFPAGVVRRFYVGREGPIRAARLTVEVPVGQPFAFASRGGLGVAPQERLAAGLRTLEWSFRDVPGRPRAEPLTPADAATAPQVVIATGASWSAVASAYGALVDRQLAGDGLRAVAAEVVPRGSSREAAAQAVLDWLRSKVRYTGLELGESSLVPATPEETLSRRFGDCKALALLAAGLLRQAGFPATLALVRTERDEAADLPGLGEFDHALVAVAGEPPLYLDATDPVSAAGDLSPVLQGRMALLAGPRVKGLTRLPEAPLGHDAVELAREIVLPENGWSQAREVRTLHGWMAADERSRRRGQAADELAALDEVKVRAHFVDAARGTVSVDGVDRSASPVRLTLTGAASHWGVTRADDAEAVVSPGALLDWLPAQVRPRMPAHLADEGQGEAHAGGAVGEAGPAGAAIRQADLMLPVAYGGTLRYRVVPPPGFEVERPLPEPGQTTLGPLTVTSAYALEADGSVTAVHALSLSRRRLRPAEVEALREGLSALLGDQPRVHFVRTSHRLLEAGRGREALDEIRRLIGLNPAEARHEGHLAQALLRLGMGEAARAAAERAVAKEPGSAWAWRVLSQARANDALGRLLAPGCDLEGAVTAERKAVELDRDPVVRAQLAFLLEHGEGCERFGDGARLAEAAALYRAIRSDTKSKEWERDHLEVLLRAGLFLEAGPVARDLPDSAERRAALLAIRAATEGVEEAVHDALRLSAPERAAAVEQAGELLLLARRYPEAAGLLDQGSGGTDQSAELKARAAMLARIRRLETLVLDPKDPTTLLQRLFRALALGGEAWKDVPEWPEALDSGEVSRSLATGFRRGLRATSGLPERVATDAGISLLEVKQEGDPTVGLRLVGVMPSIPAPLTFVVLKTPRGWRLVTREPVAGSLGAEVRRQAEAGRLAPARVLLELAREEAGPPEEGRPAAILAALAPKGRDLHGPALALVGAALESFVAPEAVRERVVAARAAAADPAERSALGWALAAGDVRSGRLEDALAVARDLVSAAPGSEAAFALQAALLVQLSRRAELEKAAAERLARAPEDGAALHALLSRALRDGDVTAALELERRLARSGQAAASDHNNLAWAMLFVEPVDPEALAEARRAVDLSHEREAFSLHTLATVHAVRGEAAEAMQVLRRAVERGSTANRPESHDWLVVGLVAERYGLLEEAVAAYRRVEAPPQPDGLSSQRLAERRLAALKQAPGPGQARGTSGP